MDIMDRSPIDLAYISLRACIDLARTPIQELWSRHCPSWGVNGKFRGEALSEGHRSLSPSPIDVPQTTSQIGNRMSSISQLFAPRVGK